MSLTRRKARPLKRDQVTFRDDRIYLVACDDTYAPEQYFSFFGIPRIQVHVIPTTDGSSSAMHVLDRLLKFDYIQDLDERWLVLDSDHYIGSNHLKSFQQTLDRARQEKVNVALSKPCFELWLLLHHVDPSYDVSGFTNATEVESALREILESYSKRNLRAADFPLSKVPVAIENAERIDSSIKSGDVPDRNTSRVYKLWRSIINNASVAQLPKELHVVKNKGIS